LQGLPTDCPQFGGSGPPRASSRPGENNLLPPCPPPAKGEPAKNLYAKSERLSVCLLQSDLGWSERVNWYGRQRMVFLRKTKTYATESVPGPHTGPLGTGNL